MEIIDLISREFPYGFIKFNKNKICVYKDKYSEKTISFHEELAISKYEMLYIDDALVHYGEGVSYITLGLGQLKISTGSFQIRRNKSGELVISVINSDRTHTAVFVYDREAGPNWAVKKGYVTTEKRNLIKTY